MGGDNCQRIDAGLPAITGYFDAGGAVGGSASGALKGSGTGGSAGGLSHYLSGGNQRIRIDFNAANSDKIYGAANTVQPPTLALIPQIKF